MPLKKRGLGKGLDAIFAENTAESTEGAVNVKISEIEPNRCLLYTSDAADD